MTDRGRSGLSLGNGLAVVVVVAALLPLALLCRERFFLADPVVVAPMIEKTNPVAVDVGAAVRAVDALDAAVADVIKGQAALEQRAVDGDRGERLRLLGRAVAKARDVRRAAGQSGPQLRSPFPVDELDLAFLEPGPDRWLLTRDGKVVLPAATTTPVSLATTGRDEEPLTVDADVGGPVKLVRRCVANEAYCVVDVERPRAAASAAPSTAALRTALAEIAAQKTTPAPTSTPLPTTTTSVVHTPAVVVFAVIALSIVLLVFAVSRLRSVGGALTSAALRLRTGLAGRTSSSPAALTAEFAALDRAIDDAFAALAKGVDDSGDASVRRARLGAVAAALDDARAGAVERVAVDASDDVVTARVVASANGLLDALDERGRRWRALVDDAAAADVSAALAQRLLRLARVPGLPQNLVDELTSLGGAVADPAQKLALSRLREEVSRVTPSGASASDRLANVAALRDLPADDVARLTRPAAGAESSSDPPRPSE